MSLSLKRKENVRAAVQRVACRRIAATIVCLDRKPGPIAGDEIHEARKQLNQLVAVLHLIAPDAGRKRRSRVESSLHNMACSLSELRDTTIMLENLQGLHARGVLTSESLAKLGSALEVRWQRGGERVLASSSQRRLLATVLKKDRRQIAHWPSNHRGWQAIGKGLRQAYRAGHATMKATLLDPSDDAFHEARKRSKDLLYVVEFLQRMRPRPMHAKAEATRRLADLLGRDHDLAVLEGELRSELRASLPQVEQRRLETTVSRRRRTLQRTARTVARGVYAETEEIFVSRLHRYWKDWRRRRY
jgi:CHAD domain-containing protein